MGCWVLSLLVLLCLSEYSISQETDDGKNTLPTELTAGNFTSYMQTLPDTQWVLVEFYAHWCGHCRNFKPEYERVSAFFASRGELQPKVLVARLDCANEGSVCNTFKVKYYPTMRIGVAQDFSAKNLKSLAEVKGKTWKGVVTVLEKQLDVQLGINAFEEIAIEATVTPGERGKLGGGAALRKEPPQVDLNDVEGATIHAWEYALETPDLMRGLESRQALQDWLELLSEHHPMARCKEGAKSVRGKLDDVWPSDSDEPSDELEAMDICLDSEFEDWTSCKGSREDSRGYSCGLWLLLHSLAARLPDTGNSGAIWLTAVKGFIKHYFQCRECSKHFVAYASTNEASRVQTKKDALLWVWEAHNKVNGRLARKEQEEPSTLDEQWPHLIWPTARQCAKCRKSDKLLGKHRDIPDWDADEVHAFLIAYYGGSNAQEPASSGLRGLMTKTTAHASWGQAGFVCIMVALVLYLVLRGSAQYKLQKSESRLL